MIKEIFKQTWKIVLFILVLEGLIFFGTKARSDVLLGFTAKYGPNGYSASGNESNYNSTTSSNHGHSPNVTTYSVMSSSDTLDVTNRYQLVPGLALQTIPDNRYGLSIGASCYMDQTISMFLGIRL